MRTTVALNTVHVLFPTITVLPQHGDLAPFYYCSVKSYGSMTEANSRRAGQDIPVSYEALLLTAYNCQPLDST